MTAEGAEGRQLPGVRPADDGGDVDCEQPGDLGAVVRGFLCHAQEGSDTLGSWQATGLVSSGHLWWRGYRLTDAYAGRSQPTGIAARPDYVAFLAALEALPPAKADRACANIEDDLDKPGPVLSKYPVEDGRREAVWLAWTVFCAARAAS